MKYVLSSGSVNKDYEINLLMLPIVLMNTLTYNEDTIRGTYIPGMCDNPDILNLHFLIRASHIFVNMSGHLVSGRQKRKCGSPPSTC